MLYGSKAILEIEGDRVILTSQSGKREDLSVTDAPDDSYHSAWFGNLAAEFESVLTGANPHAAASNIGEARTALALILAARKSEESDGSSVDLSS